MASDITLSMDVVIDKIVGLGKHAALGKTLQKQVAEAVQAGLLEGTAGSQEILRKAIEGVTDAQRAQTIKKLYAYSVRQEKSAQAAAVREANRVAREERNAAKAAEKAVAREIEQREKKLKEITAAQAALAAYSPYKYTDTLDAYTEANIARQNWGVLIRPSNRSLVPRGLLKTATGQNLIERARANYEAAKVRKTLPFNVLEEGVKEATREQGHSAWVMLQDLRNQQANETLSATMGLSLSARQLKQRELEDAFGVSASQRAWEVAAAREYKAQEKDRQRANRIRRADSIAAFGSMPDEEQKSLLETIAENTGITAATLISSAGQFLGSALPSMWKQDVSRNVYSSAAAYAQRVTMGGEIVGGVGGSVLGAILGGVLGSAGGAAGLAAGAQIGATLGGTTGKAVGGLYGKYKETELERYNASRTYALSARKDFLTYGGTGYNLSAALEDSGITSASSINQMRWTGQTLPGAMAFGMIGEQEMLMLSMMPEYFAALMNGADTATLISAYNKSVSNLPPQIRPLVASMAPGASQETYSMAMEPQTADVIKRGGLYALMDKRGAQIGEGYMARANQAALANRSKNMSELLRDTAELIRDKENLFYDPTYGGAGVSAAYAMLTNKNYEGWAPENWRRWAVSNVAEEWGNMLDSGNIENWGKVASSLESFLSQGIQIQIYMNDDLITRERINSDNASDGNFQLTAGY